MSSFRQLMMRKKEASSIYKELDYIQSSGTQYIDTGFVANQDTYFEMTFSVDNLNANYYFCGGGDGWQNNAFGMTKTSISNTNINFMYGNSAVAYNGFVANTKYRAIMDKNNFYIYEGANTSPSYTSSLTYQTFSTNATFYLFTIDYTGISGAPLRPAPMKLYSAILKDNGTIVRNLIPVRRLTDNVCGMYDTVSKTFFGNAGTGTFVGSDEILLTKVGSPTITDGVVSGFSNNNYLTMPLDFAFGDDFELQFKFTMGTLTSSIQALFNFITEIRAGVHSNRMALQITNTSSCNVIFRTSENVAVEGTIANTFSANTTYYVKYVYKNSYVTISLSTDGNTWTTLASGSISGIPTYSTERTIGYGYHNGQHRPFLGSIDFNNSYIIKNGTEYILTLP